MRFAVGKSSEEVVDSKEDLIFRDWWISVHTDCKWGYEPERGIVLVVRGSADYIPL